MSTQRYLLTLGLGIAASVMLHAAELNGQKEIYSYLCGNFEKVTLTATNMIIQFKSSGQRYFYRKNGGPLIKSEYGAILTVAVGESITIIERHNSITFAFLPDVIKHRGFDIAVEIDQRSFGKGLRTNRVFMITSEIKEPKDIKDANVVFLEPTENAAKEFLKKDNLVRSQSLTNEKSTNNLPAPQLSTNILTK